MKLIMSASSPDGVICRLDFKKKEIMKNDPEKFTGHQVVGQEIIKITETNALSRWKSFDPETREYEVESPAGLVKIHESKITKKLTPKEESNFHHSEIGAN